MKRIVFCFDGTWNKLNADTPTNVVLAAASIVRQGPDGITQIAAAIRRWHAPANLLPEKNAYRPATLSKVASALDAHPAAARVTNNPAGNLHTVASGESLGKLSKQYYGEAELWKTIFDANRDLLDDPDEIFVGQQLRIPAAPSE